MQDRGRARLDHLVFVSDVLGDGVDRFEQRTGVRLPAGGRHPLMGTHNCLTRVAPGVFLELLAIDTEAEPPERARWFELDRPDPSGRSTAEPRLLTWVLGVPDLQAALQGLRRAGIDAGRSVEQRRGHLSWNIALRDDGSLIEHGAFPVLIQWPAGIDPTSSMSDVGLRIERLRVTHPDPAWLEAALGCVDAPGIARIGRGEPGLDVTLRDRNGSLTRWRSRPADAAATATSAPPPSQR